MTVDLSVRERQVVGLLADGYDRHSIAEELGLSPDTIRTYIRRLCEEFGVPSAQLPGVLGVLPSEISAKEEA